MNKDGEPPSVLSKFKIDLEYDLTLRDIKKRIKSRTILHL